MLILYWVRHGFIMSVGRPSNFHMVYLLSFDLKWWYFTHMVPMTWGPLLNLGSEFQKWRSNENLNLHVFPDDICIFSWLKITYLLLTWKVCLVLILGSNVKVYLGIWTSHCFCSLTPQSFDLQWFYYMSCPWLYRNPTILRSKDQAWVKQGYLPRWESSDASVAILKRLLQTNLSLIFLCNNCYHIELDACGKGQQEWKDS